MKELETHPAPPFSWSPGSESLFLCWQKERIRENLFTHNVKQIIPSSEHSRFSEYAEAPVRNLSSMFGWGGAGLLTITSGENHKHYFELDKRHVGSDKSSHYMMAMW